MLSSLSYVCLGMCACMWVISGGVFKRASFSYWFCLSSRSLFQRSGHSL